MPKYMIEGCDVNFYEELYKSLDDSPETEDLSEVCLITNAPLKENHVTLACNHKFNYDAIYNDIFCHKKKYNSMERFSLKQKEIRCPYCRTIHKSLLPHVEGYPLVHGVNHYDETFELQTQAKTNCYSTDGYVIGKCAHTHTTPDYAVETGTEVIYCSYKRVKLLEANGKYYCYYHYRPKARELYKAKLLKDKIEKKTAVLLEKQKIKDEKAKAQLEEKLKKQAEKVKAKADKLANENVIISSSYQTPFTSDHPLDTSKCVQLLKTGKNKGKQCGCKIFKDSFCGRHYVAKES